MDSTMSSIPCSVECAWRKPYWDKYNSWCFSSLKAGLRWRIPSKVCFWPLFCQCSQYIDSSQPLHRSLRMLSKKREDKQTYLIPWFRDPLVPLQAIFFFLNKLSFSVCWIIVRFFLTLQISGERNVLGGNKIKSFLIRYQINRSNNLKE